jgi:hypothetical protein
MAGGAWTVGTTAAATVRSAVRRCKFVYLMALVRELTEA